MKLKERMDIKMGKYFSRKIICAFFITFFLSVFSLSDIEVQAQSSKASQLRAYLAKANAALTNQQWDSALESVNEAQQIAGRNGAIFESIRVRAYYGKKDYARAKQSMEEFYALSPSQSAITEIAAYETMINDELQKEKDRLDRLEQEEKDRIAQEEKQEREYRQLLNSVVVGEEAVKLANQVRRLLWQLPQPSMSGYRYPTTVKGMWGRKGQWMVAGGYNKPDVITNFNYNVNYGPLTWDYNFGNSLTINFITTVNTRFDNSESGRNFQRTCSTKKIYNRTTVSHRFSSTSSQPFNKISLRLSFTNVSDNDRYRNSSYPYIIGCDAATDYTRYKNSINNANKKVADAALLSAKTRVDDLDKRISMDDRQSVAYAKDKEKFEWYFNRALYRDSNTTYRSLKSDRDQKELAEQRRREAAREKKEKYDGLIASGDRAFNSGQLTSAKNYYDQALELYPNERHPKNQLSNIEKKIAAEKDAMNASLRDLRTIYNQLDEGTAGTQYAINDAISKFETHVKKYPDHALALNLYAYFLANAGKNLDIALMMAIKANQLLPDQSYILDTIGWIYFQRNNNSQAVKFLVEANEMNDYDSEESLEHLLRAYYVHNLDNPAYGTTNTMVKYARIAKQKNYSISLADRIISESCGYGNYPHCNYEHTPAVVSAYKGKWLVSYTKQSVGQQIRWRDSFEKLKSETKNLISQGYYLADFEVNGSQWNGIYNSGTATAFEILEASSTSALGEKISDSWDKGFNMTDVEYHNGTWYAVMVKGQNLPNNGYSYRDSYDGLTEAIQTRFNDGYALTAVEYGNGVYFGLFEKKNTNSLAWNSFDTQTKVQNFINKYTADSYGILSISPLINGEVFIIAEKTSPALDFEIYNTLGDFYQKVKSDWYDKGYVVRNVEYQK